MPRRPGSTAAPGSACPSADASAACWAGTSRWRASQDADRRSPSRCPLTLNREGEMTKILVVEDNDMNLDMLTERLSSRGFDVIGALDGEQGLATAIAEVPDLIVMDLSLPGVDGWELTRRLKTQDTTRRIPVLALTSHAMAGDREKALAAGCDDYDTKPIEFARLTGKIKA